MNDGRGPGTNGLTQTPRGNEIHRVADWNRLDSNSGGRQALAVFTRRPVESHHVHAKLIDRQ